MSTIRISRYKGEVLPESGSGKAASGLGFVVATSLHIGLLLLMIFMQQHIPINKKLPPSFQVDLVSYSPKLEDLLKSEKKQPKKISTKKPDKRIKPKPVKKLLQKPVKEIVKPVKKKEKVFSEKKTKEPVKVIEATKEVVEKKAEDPDQNKIRDLLSEMREKVAEQEMQEDYEEDSEEDYEEEETLTSGLRTWGKNNMAQGIYNSILVASVQQHWVFNERLAQLQKDDQNMEVLVMIKILNNGDLTDIWIETRSGNDFLDKSSIRAIKKAAPFPPLPKEFQRSSYEIGLLFSPKGLK